MELVELMFKLHGGYMIKNLIFLWDIILKPPTEI